MTPTDPQLERHRRAARAVQMLVGICIASVGVSFYDLRAGAIAFGLLLLATSAPWRTAQ